jgi:hypothetical protein
MPDSVGFVPMNNTKTFFKIFVFTFFMIALTLTSFACGGCGGGPKEVTIAWVPNGELAVNSVGGGYTVYYSKISGFDVDSATETVEITYDSSLGYTPYSFVRSLDSGTWYVKVKAYGLIEGSLVESPISAEESFIVE